jgi:imidazolonepropionase-like amidohydrolase
MGRMKPLHAATLALGLLLALPAARAQEARTWIVGATVISPERAEPERLDVLVEGEKIVEVVKALPAGAPRNAPVFDASGLYLLPGLIDSHVHLATVPGISPLQVPRYPQITREYRAQMPRSYLRYGYTTVVDLVPTDQDVLDAFVAAPVHPDLRHCGALPVKNGYPSHYAPAVVRERVFPNYVVEAKPGEEAGPHSPAAVVQRVKAGGAACVKTFYERGFGRDRDLPVPSPALFGEIVQSSHAAGIPVLLHASSIEAQRFGVDNGTDIFAHGMWDWNEANASPTLPDAARSVLDEIAQRKLGYMPTLQVIGGLRVLYEDDSFFAQDAVRRVAPASLLEWFRTPTGHWYKEDMQGRASDERMRTVFDASMRRGSESTRYLAEKNANFLFGTDTPSSPTPGNLPGLNGYLEMQRLVAAGVSLRQLLEAATINNAKAFGLADRVGTIAPGKRANLLLLARSPLESVEAYDTVRAVWIGGKALKPSELEATR